MWTGYLLIGVVSTCCRVVGPAERIVEARASSLVEQMQSQSVTASSV